MLEVPENRDDPESRTIELNIRVLKATGQDTRPDPLFLLAGGPGQAATTLAPLVAPLLAEVREARDLVFFDQRGTGDSHPLSCEIDEEAALESGQIALTREDVERCLAGLSADPRLYTTPVAMDDLEAVRKALGYGPINLWGGSYGTRAATVFMRRHPASVRAAVLDGMAPVDMRLPFHFAGDGQRALDLMLEACAEEPACDERHPSLRESIENLLRSLERTENHPVRHPRTGEWEEVPLSRDTVAAALRGALYAPGIAALVPLIVEQALMGDFGPLMVLMDPFSGPELEVGMFLSVVCAEDIPFLDREEAEQAAQRTIFGSFIVEAFADSCVHWPRGTLPAGYREPVRSDVPTLLLSRRTGPGHPAPLGRTRRRNPFEEPPPDRPGDRARDTRGRLRPVADRRLPRDRRPRNPRCRLPRRNLAPPFLDHPHRARTMIEVAELRKTFGEVVAVEEVSFTAEDGAVTGLLGPNGAGKSTTLRDALRAHAARCRERPGGRRGTFAKTRSPPRNESGRFPMPTRSIRGSPGRENIHYFAELRGIPRSEADRRIAEYARLLNMEGFLDRRARGYSPRRALADAARPGPRA